MPRGIVDKRYTGEFKKLVVETMQAERLSYRETERRFGIKSHNRIPAWEKIYLEEGEEGLNRKRREKPGEAGEPLKGDLPKIEKQAQEDLIAENQRLRAQVAYLKKLRALVLEDERKARKKRW